MKFLPFHDISREFPCAVVDARHPEAAATLSHWRGAEVPDALHADTSTEIALQAVLAGHPSSQLPYVSNNHFDVDGCLGIWSLMNPGHARKFREVLVQAAQIGDFREYLPGHPASDLALKLVCWINALEKERFYRPFGMKEEAISCIPKYEFFLPLIGEFLNNPEHQRSIWQPEYDQVMTGIDRIKSQGQTQLVEDIRLRIIEVPEPIHYYALFSQSTGADLVLMMYHGNRYELEYKYTGWIDTITRNQFPRLPFDQLTSRLSSLETSPMTWWGNSIMDTGPSVRLGNEHIKKEMRYAHPFERTIYPSGIAPSSMKEEVITFYRQNLKDIPKQTTWTWQQMRDAAERVGLT